MRAKQAYADNGANAAFGQININLATRTASRLDPDVSALLWPYKMAGGA
jgi:K+-transporting ATPase c subunit